MKMTDEFPACPCCNGEPVSLGMLGNREHLRCRNCGAIYSWLPNTVELHRRGELSDPESD